MTKISVVIPVYNVEKYLEKCLDSIIGQTLSDIEIIIINDGSTDNSAKIIERYAEKDKRIIFITQKNKGLSVARNAGINIAKGEFIGFIDSDDWVDLNFFEKLYNAAIETDADIAITGIVRKNDKKHKIRLNIEKQDVYETFEDKINLIDALNSPSVWNKIYRRSFIEKTGLRFQNVRYYEDGYFTVNALYYSNKLTTAPGTCYYYFINQNSIVKSNKNEKKIADKLSARGYCVGFIRGKQAKLQDWSFSAETFRVKLLGITLFSVKESFYSKKIFLFAFFPVWKIKIEAN